MKFYKALVLVTVLFGALVVYQSSSISVPQFQTLESSFIVKSKPTPTPATVLVTKVIDGDTIQIASGELVRYIGMDTPEYRECFGVESTKRNKELVLNKQVRLEKDISDKDKYGRLLRYAYVDGRLVNKILVTEGFARAIYFKPDTAQYLELKKEQDKAKTGKIGLWRECRN